MTDKVQIIAVFGTVMFLVIIFESIRKQHLKEQYSLLWLLTGVVLLLLSIWRDLLDNLSTLLGIYYPPSLLLLVFIGLFVLILLSFSVVVSELSTKVTRLTQKIALLENEVRTNKENQDNRPSDNETVSAIMVPSGVRLSDGP